MLKRMLILFQVICSWQLVLDSRRAYALTAVQAQDASGSAYQEIKDKFNIDMEKWLRGPAGELPDSISNLKLGLPVSEYDFSDWESKPYGKVHRLRQKDFDGRNRGQVLEDDQGKIVAVVHTKKGETNALTRALLRYGKERYGPFFLEYVQDKGMDSHLFKQLIPARGMSRSLVFVSGKDSLSIQVRQNVLAPKPETGKAMRTFLSKEFPDLKAEAYEEEGCIHFIYRVWHEPVSDAYFSRLLIFAYSFTALEKALNPDLTDWSRSKAYFLFRDKAALGWMWADDLVALKNIQDAQAQQQFIAQKFHNSLSYLANVLGKRP